MSGGWVLKMKLMLSQLSTKLELKLKLSLAKFVDFIAFRVFSFQFSFLCKIRLLMSSASNSI